MPPTSVSHPDLTAITVFLASTATPERGGLPYLDAVLPAEDRLAATRVLRDLDALPPDAILYLLAQPLLDLASDHLMRDRDLTARYEKRFEVEDSDEWSAAMAEYNREADAITAAVFRAEGEPGLAHLYLTDRRAFDRRMERGRQHFFGPSSGAHASADDDHVEGEHHRERDQRDQNPLADAVAMLTPLRSGQDSHRVGILARHSARQRRKRLRSAPGECLRSARSG